MQRSKATCVAATRIHAHRQQPIQQQWPIQTRGQAHAGRALRVGREWIDSARQQFQRQLFGALGIINTGNACAQITRQATSTRRADGAIQQPAQARRTGLTAIQQGKQHAVLDTMRAIRLRAVRQ